MPNLALILGADASQTLFVIDLLVILATAALVAIVMQRVRLAVIPAYLIAGTLVGPHSFGLVRSPESLSAISSLAVLLLMFGIGLHLHLSVFGRSLARLVTAGVASTAASVLIGWPVAMLFGLGAPAALAVCMALSLSSTALVLRLIMDRGELRHTTGQIALSILVVQDMVALVMLAALPAIARWAGSAGGEDLAVTEDAAAVLPSWGRFIVDASLRIAGITALIIFGKVALPRLLTEAARERSGEVMMIVSIAVAIGAGVLTHILGFSMDLGAFLAGFMLSATQFRHQISGQIAPLRDLFMAVFFTTLGMQLDPYLLAGSWWIVLLGGLAMSLLKGVAIAGTCWSLGATAVAAVAVGVALAQGGEFSLILLRVSQEAGLVTPEVAARCIAIVVMSLILTPAMVDLGQRFSRRWCGVQPAPWIQHGIGVEREHAPPPERHRRHVILGGYGQVGGAIGRALAEASVSYTVVELNPDTVRNATKRGCSTIFGDVSNAEVLDSAGLAEADALILTMPNEQAVLNACAVARRRNNRIFIAARMSFERHSKQAAELGADIVVVEEIETARTMKDAVLRHFGGE